MLDKAPENSAVTTVEIGDFWDLLVRSSAVSLFIVLALAYFTGEEFQHTHSMIGYAIAALLVTSLYWELLRPRQGYGAQSRRRLFQARWDVSKLGPAAVVFAVLFVLAVLALFTLLLIAIAHTFWGVSVDEIHEVVAYFALGLTVFYVAMVVIASLERFENQGL